MPASSTPYEDKEALERRLKDVDKRLLENAIQMISRLYYEEPDFKKMAKGAIDNLITLADGSKPQKYLDGLANPALREHFVQKLEEIRSDVTNRDRFSQRDLERLFNTVAFLNRGSVELPESLLVVEFVEGCISELDDFTGMVWPAERPRVRQDDDGRVRRRRHSARPGRAQQPTEGRHAARRLARTRSRHRA